MCKTNLGPAGPGRTGTPRAHHAPITGIPYPNKITYISQRKHNLHIVVEKNAVLRLQGIVTAATTEVLGKRIIFMTSHHAGTII